MKTAAMLGCRAPFSSWHFAGRAMMVMFGGTAAARRCATGLIQQEHGMAVLLDPDGQLDQEQLHRFVLHQGRIKPAALPSLGQIAPKM